MIIYMEKMEDLKIQIEEERVKLEELAAKNISGEETYQQSLVLDKLMEEYIQLANA